MELSAAQQTAAFLWSIPLGAALGVLYGVFKFSRFAFRLGKAATVLLDVLFMLVCSVCVFLLSLGLIRGFMRVYVFIGVLIGFCAYRLTLGRVLVKCYAPIIRFLRNFFKKICILLKIFLKKLLK